MAWWFSHPNISGDGWSSSQLFSFFWISPLDIVNLSCADSFGQLSSLSFGIPIIGIIQIFFILLQQQILKEICMKCLDSESLVVVFDSSFWTFFSNWKNDSPVEQFVYSKGTEQERLFHSKGIISFFCENQLVFYNTLYVFSFCLIGVFVWVWTENKIFFFFFFLSKEGSFY